MFFQLLVRETFIDTAIVTGPHSYPLLLVIGPIDPCAELTWILPPWGLGLIHKKVPWENENKILHNYKAYETH